jgi:subtilisin family serine protease
MKNYPRSIVAGAVLLAASSVFGQGGPAPTGGPGGPGTPGGGGVGGTAGGTVGGAAICGDSLCFQLVVRLQPGEEIDVINAAFGTTTLRTIPEQGLYLLQLPASLSPKVLEIALTGDPRVAWAEVNCVAVAPSAGTQSFFLSATFGEYIGQPSMSLLQVDAAQYALTGMVGLGGQGVIVAVLDTGVDPGHRMISGRLAPGGFNYIDGTGDYRDVGNGRDDNANGLIDEMVGHGTIVSGLILRVAPQARILPMRVLNCDGVGASFYVAQAIYDAIDHGATVINVSLGSIRPSQVVAEAARAALDNGILVIAAAGNHDRSDPQFFPAALETVVGVAGTDLNDLKAPFSDYAFSIDLSAPAVDLIGPFPGNAYAASSGNSLAAAVVSGAAALVRSGQPSFTPAQVVAQLKQTATEIDTLNPEYAGRLGAGRLNILNAVAPPTSSRIRR